MDDGSSSDNWNYNTWKGPVKSSPSTNQHPDLLQAGCHPTNSVKALNGKYSLKKIFFQVQATEILLMFYIHRCVTADPEDKRKTSLWLACKDTALICTRKIAVK